MESVCMYVRMSGYAFYCVSTNGAEAWHEGRGQAQRFESIFLKQPPIKGQRSSRGQVALEMLYGYQIWSEKPLTRA